MRKSGAQKFIAKGMFNKGTFMCLDEIVFGFMVFGQCVNFILSHVETTRDTGVYPFPVLLPLLLAHKFFPMEK